MSGSKRRVAYWDSCLFAAWLGDEGPPARTQEEVDGLQEQFRLHSTGQLIIVTSVITLTEVLASKQTDPSKREKFVSLFSRPDFYLINTTRQIAEVAHEIRDYYQTVIHPTKGRPLKVEIPDALHLASAIVNDVCDVFYTFDKDDDSKRRALVPLSMNVAGKYKLPIEVPHFVPSTEPVEATESKTKKQSQEEETLRFMFDEDMVA
jgi:predicted nucleic acid-binding protein